MWPGCPLLFGSGPLRQFAYDREHISLIVAGLDHHENRNREDQAVEQNVEREMTARHRPYDRPHHPINDQPGGEEVQALKGVEPDPVAVFEPARRQHDDGCNPAHGRDVAEDRRGPG